MYNSNKNKHQLSRRSFLKGSAAATGVLYLGGQAPAYSAGKRKLRYIAFINRNTVWGKPYDENKKPQSIFIYLYIIKIDFW